MTILDPSAGYFILINTFTVEPEKAEALLAYLSKATEDVFLHATGFVSANLHISDDHRHVANYAQWRSKKDYEEAGKNPAVQSHMREAATLVSSFESVFYDLIQVHGAKRET
jgi:quinol monooxygenase YgiN